MTDTATPICDLIESLLSQGLSRDMALKAARTFEQTMGRTTKSGGSVEDRRKYERERKAAYRERVSQNVPGRAKRRLYIDNTSTLTQRSKKKDSAVVPDVPGQLDLMPTDDWPEDFGDQFWTRYPPGRKHDKVKVFAALAALRRDGYIDAHKKRQRLTWAALMAGLDRFVATRPDPQFTPAPKVWLNGQRWESDYESRMAQATGGTNGNAGQSGQQNLGFAGIAAAIRARQSSGGSH